MARKTKQTQTAITSFSRKVPQAWFQEKHSRLALARKPCIRKFMGRCWHLLSWRNQSQSSASGQSTFVAVLRHSKTPSTLHGRGEMEIAVATVSSCFVRGGIGRSVTSSIIFNFGSSEFLAYQKRFILERLFLSMYGMNTKQVKWITEENREGWKRK